MKVDADVDRREAVMFPGPSVTARTWQWSMLVLGGLCAMLLAWSATYLDRAYKPEVAGSLGVKLGPLQPDRSRRVTAMDPGSPLGKAGGHVGDRLVFDHPRDRYRDLGTDEQIPVTIRSDDAPAGRRVLLRPMDNPDVLARPMAIRVDTLVSFVVQATWLVLGVLIGWRQPRPGPMRILAPFFMLSSLIGLLGLLPSARWLNPVVAVLSSTIQFGDEVGFAYFCVRYPLERPAWRLRWVRVAMFSLAAAFGLITVLEPFYLLDQLGSPLLDFYLATRLYLPLLTTAASVWALFAAWRGTHGMVKQRVAWILLCLGFNFVISDLEIVFNLLHVDVSEWRLDLLVNLGLLIGNAGLTYALLRHRVFDFGFAINRLSVYGLTGAMMGALGFALLAAFGASVDFARRPVALAFACVVAVLLVVAYPWLRLAAERIVQQVLYPGWRATDAALDAALDGAAQIRGCREAPGPLSGSAARLQRRSARRFLPLRRGAMRPGRRRPARRGVNVDACPRRPSAPALKRRAERHGRRRRRARRRGAVRPSRSTGGYRGAERQTRPASVPSGRDAPYRARRESSGRRPSGRRAAGQPPASGRQDGR